MNFFVYWRVWAFLNILISCLSFPFENYLFNTLLILKLSFSLFSLLIFRSYLHIIGVKFLLVLYVTNIFTQNLIYLLLCLLCSLFWQNQINQLFNFYICVCRVLFQKSFPHPYIKNILLYIFFKIAILFLLNYILYFPF